VYLDETPEQAGLRAELRRYLAALITYEVRAECAGAEGGGPRYREVMRRLGADGWLGLGWPREVGGQGRSPIDELIFFDQEYYWENVDPDMALVRAIYALIYSVEFQQDTQTAGWLNALKERYHLSEKWDDLADLADRKTREFVFNQVHTKPLYRAVDRTIFRAAERASERAAERARYKKMCIAANALQSMGIQHPAIYGYGIRGKMLRYVLEMVDMDVACIIDKQLPVVCGVPLFDSVKKIPAENKPDIIIVTPVVGAVEIAAELRTKVCCHVMTIEEIVNGQN
jgi:hypothetical protein